jgi:hypothetical protein
VKELAVWIAIPVIVLGLLKLLAIWGLENNADMGDLPSIILGVLFCGAYAISAISRLAWIAIRH